jgi:hypothetical protein
MATRADRVERRPWTLRRGEDRATAGRDLPPYVLRALDGGLRAVPQLALRLARRATATSGWLR